MLEEGYDPFAYVLPVKSSVDAMKTIAELRAKSKDKFESFDKAIMEFANAEGNYQVGFTNYLGPLFHCLLSE